MKRLVVTADDFGLTKGVVEGILDAHERGIVTAASLLVNAPAAEQAFRAARRTSSLAVGLHFVLSFGEPVGPHEPLGDLLDSEGRFRRGAGRFHESAHPEQVAAELRAQLDLFERRVGRPPTHIDGHHHVHAFSGVLEAVIAEAKRLGLPVRAPDARARDRLRDAGVTTTDTFVSSFFGEGRVSESTLYALIRDIGEGTTELMCHPARPDESLAAISSYAATRAKELMVLTRQGVQQALRDHRVELVSWAEVSGA